MICRLFSHSLIRLCSVLMLACFCTIFLNINNTYAVDDYTFSFDSSTDFSSLTTAQRYLCDSGSYVWRPCSDYKYIIFDFSGSSTLSNQLNLGWGSTSFTLQPYLYDSIIFDISSSTGQIYLYRNSNSNIGSVSVTITLTNSLSDSSSSGSISITENGTYDVSSYSEAVVDVPVEVNSDTVSAINGVKHAVIIGSATLLVLYFFYCIYRLIIRNSGVK